MKNTFLILFLSIISFNVFAQEPADTVKVEDVDINDIDIEDIKADDVDDIDKLGQQSTFPWDKFSVGGQLGNLQFGNTTNIGISPEIVYHATENVAFGVDGVFERTSIRRVYNGFPGGYEDSNFKRTNTGGRIFTRLQPVKTIPVFAQVEYETLNTKNPYARTANRSNFVFVNQKLNNINAGLGLNNGPYYIGLIYNFMNKDNENDFNELAQKDSNSTVDYRRNYPYNALSFRTGLNIRLGQGGGRNQKKQSRNKKRRVEE